MGYNFIALNMQDCEGGGKIKRNPFDNRRSSFVAYRGPVQRLVWCRVVHMVSPRMQPYIRGVFLGRILCDQLCLQAKEKPHQCSFAFPFLQYDDFSPNLISYRPIFFLYVCLFEVNIGSRLILIESE